jgi:hypothetical protein
VPETPESASPTHVPAAATAAIGAEEGLTPTVARSGAGECSTDAGHTPFDRRLALLAQRCSTGSGKADAASPGLEGLSDDVIDGLLGVEG